VPKWGLTKDLVATNPWSLDESVLEADKTITNSVHGDVYVNRLERMFLDSPPMQRLRRVKQLGTTHLVYPDATHVRFSHALGTLRSAQDLLDAVLDQENRPRPQYDLFREWRDTLDKDEYLKRVAEVVVLARLGALLHDICHVPFGHTIEDDLGLLERHDRNVSRFETIWSELPATLTELISDELMGELRFLILSKEKRKKTWASRYPFVQDLVGNTICADLLDYLRRDHQGMGLPLALGHRFLEGLYVTPSTHPHYKQRVAIEVVRGGQERADVVTELLKVLRYRYEESERALVHHAKLAPDAMIGKLLAMWRDALWVDEARTAFGSLEAEHKRSVDLLRDWMEKRNREELEDAFRRLEVEIPANGVSPKALSDAIEVRVQRRIETQFLKRGDEGLLEGLAFEAEGAAREGDGRRAAIGSLASGVLNRSLYKRAARSLPEDRHLAKTIWKQYGSADERRRLEVEAAEFLGLDEKWHLVLWIPHPDMRLKLAFVLVGAGDHVTTLHDYSPKVREIYESHEDLWSVGVYVHPSLRADTLRTEALLAWLRKKLGLRGWVDHQPEESVEEVAARHFAAQHDLRESVKQQLLSGVSGLSPTERQNLKAIMGRFEAVQKVLDAMERD
jgi:HD superfamily phosphohydrolase